MSGEPTMNGTGERTSAESVVSRKQSTDENAVVSVVYICIRQCGGHEPASIDRGDLQGKVDFVVFGLNFCCKFRLSVVLARD
ncbi:hypothetical protein Pla52o_14820 [Novipirellula galeiformis]|uniref:Uncharacterized protein n=1 Tax=Novipirellula galeiformis TaxID=2528004 RepID=A0A5C6CNY6_9BACT|nr:hypothetical protein Pla52o_14820 [Novipirellula galeiformis]